MQTETSKTTRQNQAAIREARRWASWAVCEGVSVETLEMLGKGGLIKLLNSLKDVSDDLRHSGRDMDGELQSVSKRVLKTADALLSKAGIQ